MYQAYAHQLLNQKESTGSPAEATHPLYVATRRLVDALNRLEQNLGQVKAVREKSGEQAEKLEATLRETSTLKQERESLNATVEQLQGQYEDLHQVASTIYGKLDDSIKRITQIIEN
jgi:uncharacterized coiled-coil DUF342 family protein